MILKIIQFLAAGQLLIAMMDLSHQCNQAHHTQKEQVLSARNAHLNHSLTSRRIIDVKIVQSVETKRSFLLALLVETNSAPTVASQAIFTLTKLIRSVIHAVSAVERAATTLNHSVYYPVRTYVLVQSWEKKERCIVK